MCPTWFCDAYASWQKGGVENDNGRLRRWLPRHTDIDKVSDEEIQDIVLTTNLTPGNASASRRRSRRSSKNLAKTCKSASHRPLHLAPESTRAVAGRASHVAARRARRARLMWSCTMFMELASTSKYPGVDWHVRIDEIFAQTCRGLSGTA
jgi:hypothetical protein